MQESRPGVQITITRNLSVRAWEGRLSFQRIFSGDSRVFSIQFEAGRRIAFQVREILLCAGPRYVMQTPLDNST